MTAPYYADAGCTLYRANALDLPLEDESVDLVVTSPPYLNLRAYVDNGEQYPGQIGSESTPSEFVDSLIAATREMVRVLKPTGSLWINLGDSYSGGQRLDNEFTALDAAWLAGVVDSDGSISIRADGGGRSHITWVRVGQMKPEVVERIGKVTGTGQVWQDKRGVWNWNAAAQQARWVLERIWPYLHIKRRQALAGIELMNRKAAVGARGGWSPLTDDEIRHRERIRQAVLAWNRGDVDDYEPPLVPTVALPATARWIPQKSLVGSPWRYALRCIDELGLYLRAEVIWAKSNGLPESVTDRVRRSHETWFHFSREPRYYSAVDEIRETCVYPDDLRHLRGGRRSVLPDGSPAGGNTSSANPLGKLPGSVWEIPTQPLRVPPELGVDHFAAFPMEWPRRIIRGWSPPGVCVECGEGRRPVTRQVDEDYTRARAAVTLSTPRDAMMGGRRSTGAGAASLISNGVVRPSYAVTGYSCACPGPTAPTRPSVILDPFGGTGTTALVAKALGRHGISVDLSADYCRLAKWRVTDPGELARALEVEKPPTVMEGQEALFDGFESEPRHRGNAGSSLVGIPRHTCAACGYRSQNGRAAACEKCGAERLEGLLA